MGKINIRKFGFMKAIFFTFILSTCLSAFSQDSTLIPYRDEDKWGFCDKEGKIAISPKFEQVTRFTNGTSSVQIQGRTGIINLNGEFIIPLDSQSILPIDSNLFLVAKRVESQINMGLINAYGKIVIPINYKSIIPRDGVLELESKSRKLGIATYRGKIMIPVNYDFIEYFPDNLCAVSRENTHALFTLNGNQLTEMKYMVIDDFKCDLSKVRLGDLFGFINKKGQTVGEINHEMNYPYSECMAVFMLNGKYGLIDKLGKVKIEPKYDFLNDLNLGVASYKMGNKWGLIDSQSKEIISAKYQNIKRASNGIIAAKQNEKWGIITAKGKEVTLFEFDDIKIIENDEQKVRDFGIKKLAHDNGYLLVSKKSQWGLVNYKGQVIIKPEYDYIYPYTNGVAVVEFNKKYALFDINGAITEFIYDKMEPYLAGSQSLLNLGILIFQREGKYGLINNKGKEVTMAKYEYIIPTDSKYFIVVNNGKSGVIDIESGTEIISCRYDKIKKQGIGFDRFVFIDDLAIVIKNGKLGYINKQGTEFFK